MKVKISTGRSSKPVDVDCHKVSCSYSGYMYLSECPSVIQLSLNVKTMNHPDLSVGWGSGGGGVSYVALQSCLQRSCLLSADKYSIKSIINKGNSIRLNISHFFQKKCLENFNVFFFVQSRIHIEEAPWELLNAKF